MQLSPWARSKAVNGWRPVRFVADAGPDRIGAQVLVLRRPPFPWAYAYAPRGPVATAWQPSAVAPFTDAARRELTAAAGRVSHLRIDPEIELNGPLDPSGGMRAALRQAGWRPAPSVQAPRTRVIDLGGDEDALWSGMRKKWRQYCSKARSSGVVIEEAGGDRLDDFYRIYRQTADRAGFVIRAASAYEDVWAAFAEAGRARLVFARTKAGEPVAALFLLRCGNRVIEPFGGMTDLGAELRANYLIKWEAIRSANEAGAKVYDMWGLPNPGIAFFKEGFGGREVRYIGAWDLVLDRAGWFIVAPLRQAVRRALRPLRGQRQAMDPAGGATE